MSQPSRIPPLVPHLEFKAGVLLASMVLLIAGSVLYVLYARGVFESTQTVVLIADDSEGVRVGMDMTFAGFPIGRVRRIELGGDGNARIIVSVPSRDAHWLRESSVFTLVRGLVGNTSLKAFTGVLTDPPLADGAERKVLVGDTNAEVPRLIGAVRDLVQNLTQLTAQESDLSKSLANVQAATGKLNGQHGALGVLLGNDADAKKLLAAVDRANALLARFDKLAAQADVQLFGAQGVVPEARAAVAQIAAALEEARGSLKRVDGLLADAQVIAGNAKVATADLGALRADVDATLRKVEALVDEINRKWPFARETEIRLP
ncbi:MAG TPA: MlaD family protein [Burkholderiaceae bacterium]|nr:MlaD family protein [Burkholderiaceae bacterium]